MDIINITGGKIQGIPAGDDVVEYRGVPFAAAPVGDKRFLGPQPVKPWHDVKTMDQYGSPVWQELNPLIGVNELGEDCLTLNIWAPNNAVDLPVMVWLHGGGFTNGTPSQLLYNGEQLARNQQVVVVTVSYRLGAWGFGYFQDIAPDMPQQSNLGLRDQLAALQWVQDNIGEFGGDSNNVTIFGESAGGFAVASLMATPSAKGLFHRAICQSGAADMVLSKEEATRIAQLVVDELPGAGTATEKLLNAQPIDVVKAQRAALKIPTARGLRDTTPQYGMPFLPVIDDLLPEIPVSAIAKGSASDIPLLAGTCSHEWNLFQYVPPFNNNVSLADMQALDSDAIKRRFVRVLPEHGEAAFSAYQQWVKPHPKRAITDYYTAMESDRIFRIPTHRLLTAHAKAGGNTWGYELTWDKNGFGLPLGAIHVMDVPFVFGIIDTPIGKMFTSGSDEARELAATIQAKWGEFARSGKADWSAWQSSNSQVIKFGESIAEGEYIDSDKLALWSSIITEN